MKGSQASSQPAVKDTLEQLNEAALNRRDFFKAAGVSSVTLAAASLGLGVAAATLGGCTSGGSSASGNNAAQDAPDETYHIYGNQANLSFTHSCDVLVIGSGIAGLSAALPLAQAGKSVIVAEKLDLLGGAAINSSGLMFVADTEIQKNAGINETVDEAWGDREQFLKSINTPHLERAKELYAAATEWVNTLADQCGSSFEDPAGYWNSSATPVSLEETSSEEGSENENQLTDQQIIPATGSSDEVSTDSQGDDSDTAGSSSDESVGESEDGAGGSDDESGQEAAGTSSAELSDKPSFLLPRNGIGSMINVMSPLRDTLTNLGVMFLTSHRARAFIVNSQGDIRGMHFVVDKPDATVNIKAQSVIVATGGFSSSPNLVHEFAPIWDQVGSYSYSETGDGQQICADAEITLSGMEDHVYLSGDIPWTDVWSIFAPTLVVSALGQRFAREDAAVVIAETCYKSGLGYWWTIFDNQLVKSSQGRSVAELINKHAQRVIGPYDSKEELAKAMGLAESSLDQVFSDYEAMVHAASDAAFGRTRHLVAMEPPYYAVKQRPVRFASSGGVSIDSAGHVLSGMGVVSKNVYACGAVADGGGEGIASCGACGLLVGRTALHDLG